jgi:hypothetical protein
MGVAAPQRRVKHCVVTKSIANARTSLSRRLRNAVPRPDAPSTKPPACMLLRRTIGPVCASNWKVPGPRKRFILHRPYDHYACIPCPWPCLYVLPQASFDSVLVSRVRRLSRAVPIRQTTTMFYKCSSAQTCGWVPNFRFMAHFLCVWTHLNVLFLGIEFLDLLKLVN